MKISQIEHLLDHEFQTFDFGKRKFPALFQAGLADAAVHAAGLGYLLALGLEWSLPAIPEYPITVHASAQWKQVGRVFPDSVWFHPDTLAPWIAMEFERFERGDENKIREKVENLAMSYYQSGETIELCVFIYWLRSSLAPTTIAPLFNVFNQGFERQRVKISPPRCKLLVYKMVMRQAVNDMAGQQTLIQELPATYRTAKENQELLVLQEIRKIGHQAR
ncbi:MAG: hypothetical protein BroJett011_07490 [Chloroflexota bacterium]|nr:MAG: hypothetical protein BroJett011_07490 [Chloroflexota bacterium]